MRLIQVAVSGEGENSRVYRLYTDGSVTVETSVRCCTRRGSLHHPARPADPPSRVPPARLPDW